MKKPLLTKTFIIIVIVIIGLFAGSWRLVNSIGNYKDWWEWYKECKAPSAKLIILQTYYDGLLIPKLSSEEVVAQMAINHGLKRENKELIKMVQYYVYHGDEKVIRKLIDNLSLEVEISLPKQSDSESIFIRYSGISYFILENDLRTTDIEVDFQEAEISDRKPHDPPGPLKAVAPYLHEQLHEYADSANYPEMVYLIMELISSNEPYVEKLLRIENGQAVYTDEGGYFANIDWHSRELVDKDVLTYLRIYVNYRDWPILKESVEWRLENYPGGWLSNVKIREMLEIVDRQGVDAAYDFYLKNLSLPKIESGDVRARRAEFGIQKKIFKTLCELGVLCG